MEPPLPGCWNQDAVGMIRDGGSSAARTGLLRVSEAAVRVMSDADLTEQTGCIRRCKTDQEGCGRTPIRGVAPGVRDHR